MTDIKDENKNETFMRLALEEAQKASKKDEVPVGAIVVYQGRVIARAHNLKEELQCATKHAEVLAIEEASRILGSWRLNKCDLYVTLEPCPMCAGAIWSSRIARLFYGASDPKSGYIKSLHQLFNDNLLNHKTVCAGDILEPECSQILKDFFKLKRSGSKT